MNCDLYPPSFVRSMPGALLFRDTERGDLFTIPTEPHGRCAEGHALEADGSCGECAAADEGQP